MKFHEQYPGHLDNEHPQHLCREAHLNTERICRRLGNSSDVSVRSLLLDWASVQRECVIQLIFLDGMVNNQVLEESFIPAIQSAPPPRKGTVCRTISATRS